jgi:hypothetical protein
MNFRLVVPFVLQADDTAKRLSVDGTDLHLELELTNDACAHAAVSAAASISTPSPAVPSSSASAVDPAAPAAVSPSATHPASKNPRRIQLTTITTLR